MWMACFTSSKLWIWSKLFMRNSSGSKMNFIWNFFLRKHSTGNYVGNFPWICTWITCIISLFKINYMCRRFSQEIQQQIEAKKDVWTTKEGYCCTNGFISVGLAFIPNEARPGCLTSWHRCSCHHRGPSKYMTCSNELLICRGFVMKKCWGKKNTRYLPSQECLCLCTGNSLGEFILEATKS